MGEDMFKDLALSREAMRDYHSKLDSQSAGLKLSVMVLQRSAWPFGAPETDVHLPPSVRKKDFLRSDSGHLIAEFNFDRWRLSFERSQHITSRGILGTNSSGIMPSEA